MSAHTTSIASTASTASNASTAMRSLDSPGATVENAVAAAALDWLARRHSVGPKHLGLPAPHAADLAQAAALAGRAPDHLQLRPYRFVRVPDARRDDLAALFAQAAQRRGQDSAAMQAAHQRAYNGPALLALVVRLQPGLADAPEHEQWLAAGAALMNFINALHLQGYGAKVLSGAAIKDTALQAAFCEPDEQLVAWITAGTPARRAHERAAAGSHTHAVLEDWRPEDAP